MILDASAVIGILTGERTAGALAGALAAADDRGIGAPTALEARLVLGGRHGPVGAALVARFLTESDVEIIPFTETHLTVATDAFLRYGKGRHPAALNFGDCMAYAVAMTAQRPLLCIGDDFPRTDVRVAALDG